MPIDLKRYPSNWRKVSLTIRRIAGWRCEWCHIPNGAPLPSGRAGKVVLTVAHLGTPYADGRSGDKHDKHDIRRENLAALCQACHLRYDLDEHIAHAKETRHRKKRELAHTAGQLPLFGEQGEEEMFHNVPARGGMVPQYAGPDEVCRFAPQVCRFAQTETCNVEPPVERVAGFAGLFSSQELEKNQGPETSHYNAISEQVGLLSLQCDARGTHGHCSASVSEYSEVLSK